MAVSEGCQAGGWFALYFIIDWYAHVNQSGYFPLSLPPPSLISLRGS